MLDLKMLQKEANTVADALQKRNSKIDIAEFLALDKERRARLTEVEVLKSERNKSSQEVAKMKREGLDASELIASLAGQADRIKQLDIEADEIVERENEWLMSVPNCPDASVPYGKDEHDNVEVKKWGNPTKFAFTPKEHFDLAADLGLALDLERGVKLAGTRFSVSKGWLARLERAIANYFLDVQTLEFGHTEFCVPLMVNRQAMTGTGQLPKFEEDLFRIEAWDYFLIPTAEVPLTNLHSGEVVDEELLPLLYTAHTPCFRSEAGSSGKDTKGLIRQHQFAKVEMVHIAHPDHSWEQLEFMRKCAETLLERLELPYRTVALCSGDMGFSSAKTYDLEVWLPGQNVYREISSCSNCTDFQARRANIRFRRKSNNKTEFVHTLNGSGLPVGRTLVAILENGQQADGSIKLPKVLVPYMNGLECIQK